MKLTLLFTGFITYVVAVQALLIYDLTKDLERVIAYLTLNSLMIVWVVVIARYVEKEKCR